MSQPSVTLTQLDGALGILPPSAGKLFALTGACSSGPVNTPASFSKVTALVAVHGDGPLVEAAAYFIERFGKPVVVIRTAASTVGAAGTVDDDDVAGTSVVTADDTATEPYDDFEVYFLVVTGGTIGTAGITFRYSLDGGRTMSPLTALGTANTYTIPRSGVTIDFAAGTLTAGDAVSFQTTAPQWSDAELTAALTALRTSAVSWGIVHVVGAVDGDAFDVIDLAVSGMTGVGKYRAWVANVRVPNAAETEAEYLTAMSTAMGSKATIYGELCAGAMKLTSSVSGRKYRRPVSFFVAALEAHVSDQVNIADVNLGPAAGVSITDANGNPDEHDETHSPGLDDARFTVLRTWEGFAGVYVNRPRCFSPEGSDFYLFPHRRVMNVALEVLRPYLIRRLNKEILVNKTTGFILESEALEIESGANAVLEAALMATPKASGTRFVLNRNENILSTRRLGGSARVTPLAYPEEIGVDVGFVNPALQVVAV